MLGWSAVAAMVALAVGMAFLISRYAAPERTAPPVVVAEVGTAAGVQEEGIRLTLSDGKEISLAGSADQAIRDKEGAVAYVSGGGIEYRGQDSLQEPEVVYHTLNVPRGKEFFLTLDDNTRVWINAETAGEEEFAAVDGLVVPGGFGVRGTEGKIAAAKYALEHDKPYLGLCLGLQMACVAAARRGGVPEAGSEEFGASEAAGNNVIYIMEGQKGKESTGGTMRLGDYPARLVKGSRVAEIYGTTEVVERHRHRYEVNQKFLPDIEKGGLRVAGTSPDGKLVEFVEAPGCRFFVATQAHPEFKSRPLNVHPLFMEFVGSLK